MNSGSNPVVRCGSCGWINTGFLTGCLHCGASLQPGTSSAQPCPSCGTPRQPGLAFCTACGARFDTAQPAAATTQPVSATNAAPAYRPTHVAPPQGMATYPAPDPQAAPGPALGPSLEVMLAEARQDGWARIVCSNGWSAWVDGRLLTPVGR
jgi:hypothetical protein